MIPPTSTLNTVLSQPVRHQNVQQYIVGLLILAGSLLVAIQFRLQLVYGNVLGQEFQVQFIQPFFIAALCLIVTSLADWLISRNSRTSGTSEQSHPVLRLTAAAIIASPIIRALWPLTSWLQLVYFVILTFVLTYAFFSLPRSFHLPPKRANQIYNLQQLWRKRELFRIWLSYNLQARYSQTTLGILWIALIPVSTSIILAIVFAGLLHAQMGDIPYVSFFLVAMVPWSLFNQAITNSSRSILNLMTLIGQIYFPREILECLVLGEAMVDLLFTFATMLVINAISGIWPNALYVFLPVILVIQLTLTLGLMLIISCLSVLVRDIPQLIGVVVQLLFYATPVIYDINSVPERFRFIIQLNPLTPIIQSYRDIIIYGRSPNWLSMIYPLVVSIVVVYVGYVFFKSNEDRLADLI